MSTTSDSPKLCPIAGCGRSRRAVEVMCRLHWLQVPKTLRDEVWRLYRRWLSEEGYTIHTVLQLREAQRDAIAAVQLEPIS